MRQGVNENKNSDNGIHLTPGILGPLAPKATAFSRQVFAVTMNGLYINNLSPSQLL